MNLKNFGIAAAVAALGFCWAGCSSTDQQPSASLTGGTNTALIGSAAGATMPSAVGALPQESFEYTVQPGDSLWKIANKFSTSVTLIQRMNNIPADQITIRVGEKLRIPGKADTERLRQESATLPASTLPTATVPTVTIPAATAPAATTPRTATSTTTSKPSSVYTSPGGTSWLPQSYRKVESGTDAAATPAPTAGSTLSATPPSATLPSATLSVTPPSSSATLPSASLSVTPPAASSPGVTISPGSSLLSPSSVPSLPSTPPPSLQTTPATGNTPAAPIGMTFQAVGPESAPTPAPATAK